MTSAMFSKKHQTKFRIVDDLKSDISFEGYGSDLNELFSSCALGLSSISYDIDMVPKSKKIGFSLSGKPEILLYDFLSKILFLVDTKEMFFSEFNVKLNLKDSGNKNDLGSEDTLGDLEREYTLTCKCLGAPMADISNMKSKVHVKAITLHNLRISKIEPKIEYIAHVSLDV